MGLISLLLFSATLVHAHTYSIDWSTIDGGGGTSPGGVYSVSVTIGQPDAGGPMTNGQYSVIRTGFLQHPVGRVVLGRPPLTPNRKPPCNGLTAPCHRQTQHPKFDHPKICPPTVKKR